MSGRWFVDLPATSPLDRYYVTLFGAASAAESTAFRFQYVQSELSINLFVFFAVFFSGFFLFLAMVVVVFRVRTQRDRANAAAAAAVTLETMARRPMAQVLLLLSRFAAHGAGRVALANAQHAGSLPVVPLALQPLARAPHVAVATVLVEFPGPVSHRAVALGSALISRRIPPRPAAAVAETPL